MTREKMAELLRAYVEVQDSNLLATLWTYLELLSRWNARTNLTAVRDPEAIVRRHFGESLAVAQFLRTRYKLGGMTLFDLGSGAGFPGAPIAAACPALRVTLIESQNKKATFLKELVRTLPIPNAQVHASRAETLREKADLVTMRAVDRSEAMVKVAQELLVPRGTLVMMLGAEQAPDLSGFAEVEFVEILGGGRLALARR
jgi:16S rRNA (guanine527-N7)-methyltransferase